MVKIKTEILILIILFLNIFISYKSYNPDIVFYNYFSFFAENLQQIYLKKFFINITILGDSLYYFLIFLFFLSLVFFFKNKKFFMKYKKLLNNINYFNLLLFFSVLISGIIAQLIKHVLGRPRPNSTNFDGDFGLKFFTMDHNFHSFPSGHSSTIFAVALVLILMIPKLKYFFYFLACVVAFSRVVVGAHFITDVIGGMVVAFIGFKLSILLLNKFFNFNQSEITPMVNKNFNVIIFAFFILSVFLTVGPALDIFVSGIFYYGKNQFLVQSLYIISIFFRKIILWLVIIYVLFLPILSIFLPIRQIFFSYKFKITDIFYIWITNILCLLFVINLILKSFWGRARPNEILELGGENFFSPWYEMSSQCSSNCSFVSGDAAVGFSLIIIYFLIKKEIYLWLALIVGFSIGSIRIMEGGHFFSDVLFSGLFVFLINFATYYFYYKKFND